MRDQTFVTREATPPLRCPVRILLIEDNPDDRLLSVRELAREFPDLRAEQVMDAEGLALALERDDFDIVITDYRLKWTDGLAVLLAVKARRPDCPVVMFTGTGSEELAVEAMKAGLDDYVLKSSPEHFARLTAAVRTALAKQAVQEHARALEAQIAEHSQQLLRAEKLAAMGSLLAGVAHELNNPLSVVIGNLALLRQAIGVGGPLAERTEKIARAAERCARIVRNFLALARQQAPEAQEVSLNRVVREAVDLVAYSLEVDRVEVKLDLAPDLPVLWADPHQLHQVVVNLIANAHQAMRAAGGARRLAITTRSRAAEGQVSLEVADTGPGIPREIQARIFEPFFTTKPPGQGTGLGLALCRGIVESHGGAIRVESRPGQGACFLVELPVKEAPTALEEARAAEPLPPVRGKAILVVDDEPEVAQVLAEILSADGHHVEIAANGAHALDKLGERAYDLILSDVKMPEVDGLALYRELESYHPVACRRIVFLTGDTLSPETTALLARVGAPSLSKPFTLDELRRVVQRALWERNEPQPAGWGQSKHG